ncbi:MAG: hypothetical protein C7B46_14610 [Sulfobacillus benefaciens]|uniref:Antitoxin n=1 Tax=Sulfobacillus benefaciens TaxID=453960 RepID=A0A2T2XCR7_9FIRM|nr:MAG: hypothetical protein C7B46_14610 [Sulfobacillus benefaciens]
MRQSYNFVQSEDMLVSSYKVLKASDVRQRWSEVVNEVACNKTRVIVEKSGVPVAGVVSPQDLEWLQERDRRMAELRQTMDEMRQAFRDVPPEEFNREVARAVQESRSRTDGPPPA